jgi:hypothetical protein
MGVLAVAILATLAAMNSYQAAAQLAKAQPDPYGAASAQQRFAPALASLPKDAPLGYMSDLSLDQKAGVAAFLAAQYAVAPHSLTPIGPGQPTEWAVGNFAKQTDYKAAGAAAGFTLVADAGQGVIVYRRTAR